MKNGCLRAFCALLGVLAAASLAQQKDGATLVRVGQPVPAFEAGTLDGKTFRMQDLKGKTVLLNFFATWCPSCKAELPELQKQVWERFQARGLVLLAIGREHSEKELERFRKENGYTFDFAPDPKREIFKLFATQNIPRNVLVGKDGTVAYHGVGYEPEEFRSLIASIDKALNP
jgi:peroxiredoxin